jgi:hypothetical protein
MDTAQLSNPIDFFRRPPFKRQTQQWPGLASKMEPPPDHGEKPPQSHMPAKEPMLQQIICLLKSRTPRKSSP